MNNYEVLMAVSPFKANCTKLYNSLFREIKVLV